MHKFHEIALLKTYPRLCFISSSGKAVEPREHGGMGRRFQRSDWLSFGLSQLARRGPDALRVKELCRAADKTIGSFYHHFADQPAFIEAMMKHWRQTHTLPIIHALNQIDDNNMRAVELTGLATALDVETEIGVRLLASRNEHAAVVLESVDQERVTYVADMYAARFNVSAEEATRLAQLEYAAFVGSQLVFKEDYALKAPALSSLLQDLITSKHQS